MALGFNDGSTQFIPDRAFARTTTPKVLTANFGDGYEQRIGQGINNLKEEYSVAFQTRDKADIDDISSYFDSLNGVTAFNFTIPDTNVGGEKTIKVVCSEYRKTHNYGNYYSIECTFKRVYEA